MFLKVNSAKKYQIDQHLGTAIHKENLKKKSQQISITSSFASTSNASQNANQFNLDLCNALVSANIPLRKIENPEFKKFLLKYCGNSLPSATMLRTKYLNINFENVRNEIKSKIINKFLWISVDETTDVKGRYIANLIIGTLGSDEPSIPYLISVRELEKTNHATVAKFVNDSLHDFFLPIAVPSDKILLLLTDAAAYMLKAGTVLKVFFPNLLHCTCLAHGLNRVAEFIRNQYPDVNNLLKNGKKIFLKAPTRTQLFRERLPEVPLPPEPIVTRWGTWLNAVSYYFQNFEEFKTIVSELDKSSALSIENAQNLFESTVLKNNIVYIWTNFQHIAEAITQLEKRNVDLKDSIKIIQTVEEKLAKVEGLVGIEVLNKYREILNKNPGYGTLCKVAKILAGEGANSNVTLSPEAISSLKDAPITSCDVERSFSAYKMVLSDRRQNFTMANLEKYLIIYCFNKY